MRYFRTTNASRQYRAGDIAVTFEPLENVGGNWSGLLAVEDDAQAKMIVAAKHPQIEELTKEEYEELKKKPTLPTNSYPDSPMPPPASSPPVRVAGGAARPASTSSSKQPPAPPPVELKSAKLEVPDELKDIAPTPKPKPKPKSPPPKPPAKKPPTPTPGKKIGSKLKKK
jgi:hypothetical protein